MTAVTTPSRRCGRAVRLARLVEPASALEDSREIAVELRKHGVFDKATLERLHRPVKVARAS